MREEIAPMLPELNRYARHLTKDADRSADLVQDTIVRALEAEHQFHPGTNLKAWMTTIMRNIFFNSHRPSKRRLDTYDPQSDVLVGIVAPSSREARDDLETVGYALARMPSGMLEALHAIAIDGLDYEGAAISLGVKVGTVKSRVSRARAAITDEMRRAAA